MAIPPPRADHSPVADESPVRVLVVDDHQVVREGIVHLLSTRSGLTAVGAVADGHAALRAVADLSPDVVLLDLSLRDIRGFEVLKRIVAEWPRVRVLVLSMLEDPSVVRHAMDLGAATPREREVLALVAKGLSSRAIGEQLGLSHRTVETHRRHIGTKLGAGSVAELVRAAVRLGLVE